MRSLLVAFLLACPLLADKGFINEMGREVRITAFLGKTPGSGGVQVTLYPGEPPASDQPVQAWGAGAGPRAPRFRGFLDTQHGVWGPLVVPPGGSVIFSGAADPGQESGMVVLRIFSEMTFGTGISEKDDITYTFTWASPGGPREVLGLGHSGEERLSLPGSTTYLHGPAGSDLFRLREQGDCGTRCVIL